MSKFELKNKPTKKIDEDVALKSFLAFLNYYGLDLDQAAENITNKSGMDMTADDIGDQYLELIQTGEIEIEVKSDNVIVTQNFNKKYGDIECVKYGTLLGKHKLAGSKVEMNGREAQVFAIMSSVSNLPEAFFRKDLKGRDLKNMMAIGQLYFLL
jgi:hypothetical protein